MWKSNDGQTLFSVYQSNDGSKTLNIFLNNGERLYIKNWSEGNLGISLTDGNSNSNNTYAQTAIGTSDDEQFIGGVREGYGDSGIPEALNAYVDAGDGNDAVMGIGDGTTARVWGDPNYSDDMLIGGSGNDAITGLSGEDTIDGGEGNDFIVGGYGKDLIQGGEGDDFIISGLIYAYDRYHDYDVTYFYYRNDDTAKWKDGAAGFGWTVETLTTSGGTQILNYYNSSDQPSFNWILNPGFNYVDQRIGASLLPEFGLDVHGDTVDGGDGNDMIQGSSGSDYIQGGDGDDAIISLESVDFVWGGAGNDSIDTGKDDDYLDGGDGNDLLAGNYGNDVIYGGNGNDYISGDLWRITDTSMYPTSTVFALMGDDWIDAGAGDDSVEGGGGNDLLMGGDGDDVLQGDSPNLPQEYHGRDTLYGGDGNDTLRGGGASDFLYGDAGSDSLLGNEGDDFLDGGSGSDLMFGEAGFDTILGGDGDDTLSAGEGDDYLSGEDGVDILQADGGNDLVDGGDGNDYLDGGYGDDIIIGGVGVDELYGGAGNDTFILNLGDSEITESLLESINDTEGNNKIQFGAGISKSDLILDSTYANGSGDLILQYSSIDYIYIKNGLFGSVQLFEFADGSLASLPMLLAQQLNSPIDISASQTGLAMYGGNADDIIVNYGGSSIFTGGAGNDSLTGYSGGNTYIYNLGDGLDTITDTGGILNESGQLLANTLKFGTGISVEDIKLSISVENGNALRLNIGSDGNGILLNNFSHDTLSPAIDRFEFANGNVLSYPELLELGIEVSGTTAGETVRGSIVNDTINGYAGDDVLIGGDGNDTYMFALGDGADIIEDSAGINQVIFGSGISPDSIVLSQFQADDGSYYLEVRYGSGNDSLLIKDGLSGRILSYTFSDGTILTHAELVEATNLPITAYGTSGDDFMFGTTRDDSLSGGYGDDQLTGFAGNDTLRGGRGNDLIDGGDGNDVIDGGSGNDSLSGGSGTDAYFMKYGMGKDIIFESGLSEENVIRLEAGLSFDSLVFNAIGNDLYINIQDLDEGVLIKDYYLNSQSWTLLNTENESKALTEIIDNPSPSPLGLIDSAIASYENKVRSVYFKGLGEHGYALNSNGGTKTEVTSDENSIETTNYSSSINDIEIYSDDAVIQRSSQNFTAISNLISSQIIQSQLLAGSTIGATIGVATGSGGAKPVFIPTSPGSGDDSTHDFSDASNVITVPGKGVWILPPGSQLGGGGSSGGGASSDFYKYYFSETSQLTFEKLIAGASDNFISSSTLGGLGWLVDAGAGNDVIYGGRDISFNFNAYISVGYDYLVGGPYYSEMNLGSLLYGNSGNDIVVGGDLNDILVGGDGNDFLDGSFSSDTYLISSTDIGTDVIFDSGYDFMWYVDGEYLEIPRGYTGDRTIEAIYEAGYTTKDTVEFDDGISLAALEFSWGTITQLSSAYPSFINAAFDPFQDSNLSQEMVTLELKWGAEKSVKIAIPFKKILQDTTSDLNPISKWNYGEGIELFKFADGTVLTMEQLLQLAPPMPITMMTFNQGDGYIEVDSQFWGAAIKFGNDISIENISFARDGNDLLMTYENSNDQVRVKGVYVNPEKYAHVSGIFHNIDYYVDMANIPLDITGTEENDQLEAIDGASYRIFGQSGNDTLVGANGNDTLFGELGDDILSGGAGSDTYRELLGNDRIIETNTGADEDVIELFVGPNDVSLTRSENNLVLAYGENTLTIDNWYGSNGKNIEKIVFGDGSTWDKSTLEAMAPASLNNAPVTAIELSDAVIAEDSPLSIDLSIGFADSDTGDQLIYTAELENGNPLPSWISFDPVTGILSGLPQNSEVGSTNLKVTATDLAGESTSQTFVLTVINTNDAPVLVGSIENQQVVDGNTYTYTIPSTLFQDVDLGDTLTLSMTQSNQSPLPTWLTFDPQTLTLTGSPSAADIATPLNLTVTASDTSGSSVSTSFILTVAAMAAQSLVGTADNDVLAGGSGNDTLNGGAGADSMSGGYGNDLYIVDNSGDVITENASEGSDTVQAPFNYVLAANVENLTLTGTGATLGTGNALANVIIGNSGNNTLRGNGGADTLNGGAGTDTVTYSGQNPSVRVNLTTGLGKGGDAEGDVYISIENVTDSWSNDLIIGNSVANRLDGTSGNDILQGMSGNDSLADSYGRNVLDGGDGHDYIYDSDQSELIIGGKGNDEIYTGAGQDIISFNKGDGVDDYYGGAATDNTLSLGGSFSYNELSFRKSGNDLVLNVGTSQINLKSWYAATPIKSVLNLQVIAEAMADFNANGTDTMLDNKVEKFDFIGIVNQFDTALAADANLTSWSLTNALLDYHLGGSDTAAIGGDLAYQYGLNGSLAGMGLSAAQSVINSTSFGQSAQTLHASTSWQSETTKLA
ncbi:putative Ig domain-containing protein [Methylovorus sp. SPW-M1]